jgi:hypothetical protein
MEEMLCAMALKSTNGRQTHHKSRASCVLTESSVDVWH